MVQTAQLVTQQISHPLDGILRTNHHYTVAHLQTQLTSGKQVHTRTVDTSHVHPIHAAEVKFSQGFSVDVRLCHQYTTGNHRFVLLIGGIPILFNFRTDESHDSFRIIFGTYQKHAVAQTKHRTGIRRNHVSVLDDACTHKITRQEILYLRQCLAAQSLVLHLQGDGVRLHVGICLLFFLDFLTVLLHIYPADITDDDHGKNNTHYAQRISAGISHGNFRTLIMQLLQGLVGRTKSRSVGHCSTKDTHHHRNINPALQGKIQNQCYCNVQEHNSHRQQVERDTPSLERRKKGRTDLKSDTEDKENQSEVLYERKNSRISGKAEVSCQDSDKQDECNSQRNAEEFNFSQQYPRRNYKSIECYDMRY
ncbi:uncharacterized protein BN800_01404 [Bacteroides sp. CAG:875]|nr:uncharacterized protein BN800_01404 [Bacteroides sp. CAG:875]